MTVFVAALGLFAGESIAGKVDGRIAGMDAAAVTGGVGAFGRGAFGVGAFGVGDAFCKSFLVLLVIGGVGVYFLSSTLK